MSFHYVPESTAIELQRAIDHMAEYRDYYIKAAEGQTDAKKKKNYQYRAGEFQRDIVALQGVLRRLEMTNDIKMNFIAEDICNRIMAVRKDKLADKFVGIIVYYELQPRYDWRADGLNPVACVSNVKGWPYGHKEGYDWQGSMTDMGDNTFVADHPHAGPGCWVIGGQYIPINVDLEDGKA